MFHVITTTGFKQSVCDNSFYNSPLTKFWAFAFTLSKAPELGKASFTLLMVLWSKIPSVKVVLDISCVSFAGSVIDQVKRRLDGLNLVFGWLGYI